MFVSGFENFVLVRLAGLMVAVVPRVLVRDTLGTARQHLGVQRRRRFRLAPLPRNLGVLVLVLGIAGGAARLLDVGTDHRHDRVVRHTPLARTIIVQNVTKPKLALLHQDSRAHPWRGEELRKAKVILAQPQDRQPRNHPYSPGSAASHRWASANWP